MLVDLPTTHSWGGTVAINPDFVSHIIARGKGGAWLYLAPKKGAPYWVKSIERVPIELPVREVKQRINDARRQDHGLV